MNWNPVSMPTPLQDEWIWLGESRFAVSGNTIWLCTNKGRVFKSTDRGYTWTVILSEAQYYDWRPSIAFQNSLIGIYALNIPGDATDHVVRKTTDGGATWVTLSNPVLANLAPSCIQYIPGTNSTYVMVGGRAPTMRGTAVTYDAGVSWTLLDTTGCFLTSFASSVRGWGSPFGGNVVYRYTGTPLPVEEETTLPAGCLLSQNYPNPFNPVTTIEYQLPRTGRVSLVVYDLLGREVATLVDGTEEQGFKSVTFDASSLASGIYLYRLRAGDYSQTRTMAVVK